MRSATSTANFLRAVLLSAAGAAGSLDAAPFTYSLRAPAAFCPKPGVATFDVISLLHIENVPTDPAVIGWNVSLEVAGPCEVVEVRLGRHAARMRAFDAVAEKATNGQGAVTGVALDFRTMTLGSAGGPYELMTVTLRVTGPGVCRLSFQDGLRGTGRPFRNAVTDLDAAQEIVPRLEGATIALAGPEGGPDCNGNGVPDACDLASGKSLDGNLDGVPDECDAESTFRRGDANADGKVDISDAVATLTYLFLEAPRPPPCLKGADSNDDGRVNISDASYTLNGLFLGQRLPPPPGP